MTDAFLQRARGTLNKALEALKAGQPVRAEQLCAEFLRDYPGSVPHRQALVRALIRQQRFDEAEQLLEEGLRLEPGSAALRAGLGGLYAQTQRLEQALEAFRAALAIDPANQSIGLRLAKVLQALGRGAEAEQMLAAALHAGRDATLLAAGAEQLRAGQLAEAGNSLRQFLRAHPANVDAMRLLAQVYREEGRKLDDAEALLRKAVDLAPDFVPALQALGELLGASGRWAAAAEVYVRLGALQPADAQTWALLAQARKESGDPQAALAAIGSALRCNPDAPGIHLSHANLLATLVRADEAIASYRHATRLNPGLGEAWWGMAALEASRFSDAELQTMTRQLGDQTLPAATRAQFHFALGRAHEDLRDFPRAWQHYHEGNTLQRGLVDYDPVEQQLVLERVRRTFTPELVERLRGRAGCADRDPIFIVGLPGSGAALIERMLASHSRVESAGELQNIAAIALGTGGFCADRAQYPETVPLLEAGDFETFARRYLAELRHRRPRGRVHFIDATPANFAHLGWIRLMFPNAPIVHARRFPLDNCLGLYTGLLARDQHFSHDLFELSQYYRDHAAIMDHWHALFPGGILDVHYEELVQDPHAQLRRLLDFCDLPFEEACLPLHLDARAPGHWRHYADHLELWREDLAPIIERLPDAVKAAAKW